MPQNYLQDKEFTWLFQFFLFRSSNKILKKKVLGVQADAPCPSKQKIKTLKIEIKKRGPNNPDFLQNYFPLEIRS